MCKTVELMIIEYYEDYLKCSANSEIVFCAKIWKFKSVKNLQNS